MPEHQDWFSLLLGTAWERLTLFAGKNLGDSWLFHEPVELHHVAGALLVFLVALILAIRAVLQQRQRQQDAENSLLPDRTLTARNFFEIFCELILGQMERQMGDKDGRAKKYFPLIASFALFIFFSNCLGLIPG